MEDRSELNRNLAQMLKGGVIMDVTTPEQAKKMLEDLADCKNPYSCPHGRPTFIKMTTYDIERSFRRK